MTSRRVTVSISDPPEASAAQQIELQALFLRLTTALLDAGYEIAYGGDHRRAGYVERLAEAAAAAHRASGTERIHNYLTQTELSRTTEFVTGVHVIAVQAPGGERHDGEVRFALELSEMRRLMTADTLARIVIGGRLLGAQGTAPGVLEEAYRSAVAAQPLLVIGGFGGIGALVGQALAGAVAAGTMRDLATDPGYSRRLPLVAGAVSAAAMIAGLHNTDLHNALDATENARLLAATDPETIVELVLKSVRKLSDA